MDELKKLPCWAKVAAAIMLVVFAFNYPANSSEWAAWVQALGTIAAVCAAIFLSRSQGRLSREIQESEWLRSREELATQRKETIRAIARVVDICAKAVGKSCDDVISAKSEYDVAAVKWREPIDICLIMLDRVAVHEFPGILVAKHVLNMRLAVAKLKTELTSGLEQEESLETYQKRLKVVQASVSRQKQGLDEFVDSYDGSLGIIRAADL